MKNTDTIAGIMDAVGRAEAKAALGVGDRAIQVACQTNIAPASWFDQLERMTRRRLPRELFTFKVAAE